MYFTLTPTTYLFMSSFLENVTCIKRTALLPRVPTSPRSHLSLDVGEQWYSKGSEGILGRAWARGDEDRIFLPLIYSCLLLPLLIFKSLCAHWDQNYFYDLKQENIVFQFKSKRRCFMKPLS